MSQDIKSQDINKVDIVEEVKDSDYCLVSVNGSLRRVLKKDFLKSVSASKIGEVTLPAASWVGEGSLFSQVVNIAGVTANSQVDLTPSIAQLAVFYEKDITFVTENDGGKVTVYVIGQKPQNDYTIQVTITEVV